MLWSIALKRTERTRSDVLPAHSPPTIRETKFWFKNLKFSISENETHEPNLQGPGPCSVPRVLWKSFHAF